MADTPPIRKFLFDKSFDDALDIRRAVAKEPPPVSLRPEQLEAIKKEAWDEGFAAGRKESGEEQAHKLMMTLGQLEARMVQLIENFQEVHKSQEKHLRNAIMVIAKKILPDFTARQGTQEIESMLGGAIGDMLHEPRLVVRIHESQFDTVNARITEITTQKAYAGKVVVLADPEVKPGDCRIEWADGGIERNTEATWRDIENVVAPDQNPAAAPSEPTQDPIPSQPAPHQTPSQE